MRRRPEFMDNVLLKLREKWFVFGGDWFSKKYLTFAMEMLEEGMKFAGLWDNKEPDSRIAHDLSEEEYYEIAREEMWRRVTLKLGGLDSSYCSEGLIDALAMALPILVEENKEAKRQALERERDRIAKQLEELDAKLQDEENADSSQ